MKLNGRALATLAFGILACCRGDIASAASETKNDPVKLTYAPWANGRRPILHAEGRSKPLYFSSRCGGRRGVLERRIGRRLRRRKQGRLRICAG